MPVIETFVEVHSPINTVYKQWLQFESYPQFMEGIEKVEELDDGRIRWRATVSGAPLEWESQLVENVPERRIAWRSAKGLQRQGIVAFRPVGPEHTRVTLRLEYDPDGYVEDVGKFLVMACRRVDDDLGRFRDLIERRRAEKSERPPVERRRTERRRAA
jgi:uncharacterized membrane protein